MEKADALKTLRQYSIRALFGVVTLCAVLFAIEHHRAQRYRSAVHTVLSNGGKVEYEHQWKTVNDKFLLHRKLDPYAQPPGAIWVRKLFGEHYFIRVASIDLSGTEWSDKDSEIFAEFASLRSLNLSDTRITDEGLRHLQHLRRLHTLSLEDTAVTGTGFSYLVALPSLKHLVLDGNQLTSSSASRLRPCKSLGWISLAGGELSFIELKHVQRAIPGAYIEQ